jgi:hypothetical protein
MDRFFHLKTVDGLSYEKCRTTLVHEFGEDNVPKLTTLKNYYHAEPTKIDSSQTICTKIDD